MNRQELIAWITAHWENLLQYAVYNNPAGWRQFISDHSNIPDDQAMNEDQMISFVRGYVIRLDESKREFEVKKMAGMILHNDSQTNWANFKRG